MVRAVTAYIEARDNGTVIEAHREQCARRG